MGPEETWVGVQEVAAHLQVAKESVYRWIDSKGFPAHRVGRLLRFKLSEVDQWVRGSGKGSSDADARSKRAGLKAASRKPDLQKKNRHG
jgi:excisionase family DNA binding protein